MTTADRLDDAFVLPRCLQRRAEPSEAATPLPLGQLLGTVLLPFATGYFLSYVFRQINIVLAAPLRAEFDISAAQLGLMTSMYFLAFGVVLLPLGAALDRYGPRIVQSLLMLVAAAGAVTFAWAGSFLVLMVGRVVIGVGVAVALMAGLKAIVLWVRPERIPLANGCLVTFGTFGAIAATLPAEILLENLGWRGLFQVLGVLCVLSAVLTYVMVPEREAAVEAGSASPPGVGTIYRDRRFWRIAPMAATVIAASWSLQGLWAAPWLSDVEGLPRHIVVRNLFIMALALSVGGLALGACADRLRRRGISPATLLSAVTLLSITAQTAIVLRLPIPSALPWSIVALVGASAILGYASVTELFPRASSGRATAALNLLQMAGAFALQCAVGFLVALWPAQDGRPPASAYQAALTIIIGVQLAAFGWFVIARDHTKSPRLSAYAIFPEVAARAACRSAAASYERAAELWIAHVMAARRHVLAWRAAATGSAVVALVSLLALTEALFVRDAVSAQAIVLESRRQ